MKRKLKKSLSLLLASAMLATAIGSLACSKEPKTDTGKPDPKETGSVTGKPAANTPAPKETELPANPANPEIGDYYTFGAYEQDSDLTNGKEPIKWIVLDKEGSSLLLMSKFSLDCKPFNAEDKSDDTWEACTLRAWLNSEFINEAFSSSEMSRIQTTHVETPDNPHHGTPGGNATDDKVFILSYDEACKYFDAYCFDERFDSFLTPGVPTAYVETLGLINPGLVRGRWWLRSPGASYFSGGSVAYVDDGVTKQDGIHVSNDNIGVRPVVWVNP